eukprot:scaffold5747_cov128-Isochrysis_galbana.AAC.2
MDSGPRPCALAWSSARSKRPASSGTGAAGACGWAPSAKVPAAAAAATARRTRSSATALATTCICCAVVQTRKSAERLSSRSAYIRQMDKASAWNVLTRIAFVVCAPRVLFSLSRIACSAARVNVTARMVDDGTPWASICCTLAAITPVLPEPAPANTSSGRCRGASHKEGRAEGARAQPAAALVVTTDSPLSLSSDERRAQSGATSSAPPEGPCRTGGRRPPRCPGREKRKPGANAHWPFLLFAVPASLQGRQEAPLPTNANAPEPVGADIIADGRDAAGKEAIVNSQVLDQGKSFLTGGRRRAPCPTCRVDGALADTPTDTAQIVRGHRSKGQGGVAALPADRAY